MKINKMSKDEIQLEQEYSSESDNLSTAYNVFQQKSTPTAADIQNIKEDIVIRSKKIDEIDGAINGLKIEYSKQLPGVNQQLILERLTRFQVVLDLNRAQGAKLNQLMEYASTVDFNQVTSSQAEEMKSMMQAVDDFHNQLSDAPGQQ